MFDMHCRVDPSAFPSGYLRHEFPSFQMVIFSIMWWFQRWDRPNVQTEDQKTNHFTLMCGLGKKRSYISSFSTLFFPVFLDRNERNSIQIRDLHLKLLCPTLPSFFSWDIWSVSNLLQDNLHVCFFSYFFLVILHSCA